MKLKLVKGGDLKRRVEALSKEEICEMLFDNFKANCKDPVELANGERIINVVRGESSSKPSRGHLRLL